MPDNRLDVTVTTNVLTSSDNRRMPPVIIATIELTDA